jgi:hypothetical protein
MNSKNQIITPAIVVWCVALVSVSFYSGFYRGQIEIYRHLYDDKIECKLTADEFIQEVMPDK